MLLNGMKVTKGSYRVHLFRVLILLLLLVIAAVAFAGCKGEPNYYEKIVSLSESSDEIKIKDVFEFDFDKAYISVVGDETYADEKHFLAKLNVESDIDIPAFSSEGNGRILFIKDNKIIYNFTYETSKINIVNTGTLIFPDTPVILARKDSGVNDEIIIEMDLDVSNRSNYLNVSGVVSYMKYTEAKDELYIVFEELSEGFPSVRYSFVGKNITVAEQNGIADKIKAGETVNILAAPKCSVKGNFMPIVEISIDGETLLEFEDGYNNLLEWIK